MGLTRILKTVPRCLPVRLSSLHWRRRGSGLCQRQQRPVAVCGWSAHVRRQHFPTNEIFPASHLDFAPSLASPMAEIGRAAKAEIFSNPKPGTVTCLEVRHPPPPEWSLTILCIKTNLQLSFLQTLVHHCRFLGARFDRSSQKQVLSRKANCRRFSPKKRAKWSKNELFWFFLTFSALSRLASASQLRCNWGPAQGLI